MKPKKAAAREARHLPLVVLGEENEEETSCAGLLRQLGADVRAGGLFADADALLGEDDSARVAVIEAGERPDLAVAALRQLRHDARLARVPVLAALPARYVSGLDPAAGFDDFIVMPCTPTELYARIRKLEWQVSEFANEERIKVGGVVVDRAGHEVSVDGRRVTLTAREFALLAFLAQNRGKVLARETLLARVWGSRYEGGPRTVDIHVRRLRAKLGEALPLETLRGAGYVLRAPGGAGREA